jgi:vitamin B12 transporter
LQLRVGNVLDKEYETVAWYNQPERNATVTLRYRP